MKPKTVADLHKYVGLEVEIQFWDGSIERGTLGYTKEFSAEYGYRRLGYFTINNTDFKVSHINNLKVIEPGE